MDQPKFTVVTPSFNQGSYIEKTIDSVLSQNYPNLEFIIIDGGSKDNTVEVIKKYERHLSYWVSEPDSGQSDAINKGMARATGEYLTWLNSDDWYLPDALNSMSQILSAAPSAGLVAGAGRVVDMRGKELYAKEPTTEITIETLYGWLSGGNFMQPSSAFRAEAWRAVGGLDESIHIAMDLDLWIRLAKAGYPVVTTRRMLSEALSHPDAKTTAFEDLMRLDCALVIIRHGGEHVVRKTLENIINQFSWYRRNYEAIVGNPLLKVLLPLIKRFSGPGDYWQQKVPPWVKDQKEG